MEVSTTIAGEFASAMQQLSAEAEKTLPEAHENRGANSAMTASVAQMARDFTP